MILLIDDWYVAGYIYLINAGPFVIAMNNSEFVLHLLGRRRDMFVSMQFFHIDP